MASSAEPPATPRNELWIEVACATLAEARSAVQDWLADTGVVEPELSEMTLVVSELVSNACEHGAGPPVIVTGRRSESGVSIAARNPTDAQTRVPPSDEWTMPEPLAPRGRGLAIVARLADTVEVRHHRSAVHIEAFFACLSDSQTLEGQTMACGQT